MNKENKLGMGLGALLSTTNNDTENSNGIQKINISQIVPNPSQPRKNFKDEDLKELSSSSETTCSNICYKMGPFSFQSKPFNNAFKK